MMVGRRPPANESCMEWQGLATQPTETLIRKSTLSANLSHRKWLEEPNLIAGVGLVRACESL